MRFSFRPIWPEFVPIGPKPKQNLVPIEEAGINTPGQMPGLKPPPEEKPLYTTPSFRIPKKIPGMISAGNIDLTNRPVVINPDGTKSTVKSMSFNEDGKEILIPTVSDSGRIMSEKEAIDVYHKTGKNLGVFDNPANANSMYNFPSMPRPML